eukprot:3629769-Pyramimonas_sp.AAC.1
MGRVEVVTRSSAVSSPGVHHCGTRAPFFFNQAICMRPTIQMWATHLGQPGPAGGQSAIPAQPSEIPEGRQAPGSGR